MRGETNENGGFRPEIQALRALAVGVVVVFHLWPTVLPGGYIGVDVFFVISGFLITGHLLREIERTGGISLAAFWARRIRRLLPAASVVLAASLLAMVAFVPRSLWQQTVTEVGASALYVQNWVLASGSVDYLGAEDTPTVVQHFWSLSVEEQFYIAWPLLLLAALLLGRQRRQAVLGMLALVLVLSLLYSIAESGTVTGYFDTGTRAWEFAAGGLLAAAPRAIEQVRGHPNLAALLSWLGLLMIAGAAALFSAETPFPSAWAAVPVLGAVLVIVAGANGANWGTYRVAAARPLQAMGDLSYSIYLWHWPLVMVVPYALAIYGTVPESDLGWKLAVVALSFALAWITKRFVEDRFRGTARSGMRIRRSYALAAVMVGVLIAGSSATWGVVQAGTTASAATMLQQYRSNPCHGAAAMVQGADCPTPFAVTEQVDTAFAAGDRGALALPCNSGGATVVTCEFGDLDDPLRTIAVVGNSHAAALVPALDEYGTANRWKVILMRQTDCLGVSLLPLEQPGGMTCTDWTANVMAELMKPEIDAVVFGTHANAMYYLSDVEPEDDPLSAPDAAALQQHIGSMFAGLVDSGKSVLVVGDTPGTRPTPAPECVYLSPNEYDPCSRPRDAGPTAGLEDGNIVSAAARETEGVGYFSLMPYVCDSSTCHVVVGETLVYFDDHHLSGSFSRSLAPYLGAAVEEQLAEQLAEQLEDR